MAAPALAGDLFLNTSGSPDWQKTALLDLRADFDHETLRRFR